MKGCSDEKDGHERSLDFWHIFLSAETPDIELCEKV